MPTRSRPSCLRFLARSANAPRNCAWAILTTSISPWGTFRGRSSGSMRSSSRLSARPECLCRPRNWRPSPLNSITKQSKFMAIINQATKELQVKIVYYGPAMGGKTTNLVQVHDHVQTAAGNKGKLVSLATSSDRTLFFDFLPIEAMSIKGFKTKFQLYTVPGQVIYNTTRQLVLRGVDGIVFVADSQYDKMTENVESFTNLEENLKTLKLNLQEIPYVLQYNKRDLPNVAPVEYMEFLLNNREVQVPSFTSSAHRCEGVFETLNMITRMLLHKFVSQGTPQYA